MQPRKRIPVQQLPPFVRSASLSMPPWHARLESQAKTEAPKLEYKPISDGIAEEGVFCAQANRFSARSQEFTVGPTSFPRTNGRLLQLLQPVCLHPAVRAGGRTKKSNPQPPTNGRGRWLLLAWLEIQRSPVSASGPFDDLVLVVQVNLDEDKNDEDDEDDEDDHVVHVDPTISSTFYFASPSCRR
ncbi:hypothetical protein M0802_004741 [Mischocyttarus mexicanus]|nr:hypothetical protein M0802_004741 [Mischocyttarus mexicanus]